MRRKRSPILISIVCANVGALVAALLMMTSFSNPPSLPQVEHGLAYALIYANCCAIAGGLLVPRLANASPAWAISTPVVIAIGSVSAAAIGCLAAQTILTIAGIAPAANFWRELVSTLKTTSLLAAVFGMGAFFYASTKEQLRQTTAKLHEKELAEERARKLALEARLASLESRLRPHFLFNAMNSVAALIPIDPSRADEMLTRLSRLLRTTLDNTESPLVSLRQEIQTTEEYLAIERMRLGDQIRTRIDVPDPLGNAAVPPFSIQALAENAVKHGISRLREGGEILITAEGLNGSLYIRVSDDGPGFDLTDLRAGHGLDTLVARLDAIFGSKARLNVTREHARCIVELVVPR